MLKLVRNALGALLLFAAEPLRLTCEALEDLAEWVDPVPTFGPADYQRAAEYIDHAVRTGHTQHPDHVSLWAE